MTAFGFSLSGHFFDEYKDDLRAIGCMPLDELQVSKENVCVGGVISSIRQINGKRGVMGVVGIDDGTHSIEFFAFFGSLGNTEDLDCAQDGCLGQGKAKI